ncbi:insulinase family protein [candidate division KSB1 bacterium]|nr:insulinase family protein [candidate division KSB1 bacterium]
MKSKILVAIIFLLAPLLALSAGEYGILATELDNGLAVIVVENHTVPLVTVEICVKNGAFTEPPEFDGLSHLYEHMFFKANRAIPNQERFLERGRELGTVWNGTTSTERVNYFFTLPKDSLSPGMIFMRDAICSPLFDQVELERERSVVLAEYDRAESSPFYYLGREVNRLLWYQYPSRKNVLGDRDVINTATREKMFTIQQRFYIPNNSALFLAGDLTPEEGFSLARGVFGDWSRGEGPFESFPVPEHPPLTENRAVIINDFPVQAVTLQMQLMGPSVTADPGATFAADVFSYILSQPNSRFQRNLIDTGLAVRASIGYYTQAHTGPINISMQSTANKFQDAREALLAEMAHFADPDYYTDEQLESAKNRLEIQEVYSQERTSSFVHTLSFWWAVVGLDYYLDYIDNLRKVDRQAITDYLSQYILDKPYVVGVLISTEDQEKIDLKEEDLLP